MCNVRVYGTQYTVVLSISLTSSPPRTRTTPRTTAKTMTKRRWLQGLAVTAGHEEEDAVEGMRVVNLQLQREQIVQGRGVQSQDGYKHVGPS